MDAVVEQIAAEHELQPLDLRAHRRLRYSEFMRCLGEAAQVDDGNERSQQFGWDIDHLPLTIKIVLQHFPIECRGNIAAPYTRAFAVHANDDVACAFYGHFDFVASPTDPTNLILLLKDVKALINRSR